MALRFSFVRRIVIDSAIHQLRDRFITYECIGKATDLTSPYNPFLSWCRHFHNSSSEPMSSEGEA